MRRVLVLAIGLLNHQSALAGPAGISTGGATAHATWAGDHASGFKLVVEHSTAVTWTLHVSARLGGASTESAVGP